MQRNVARPTVQHFFVISGMLFAAFLATIAPAGAGTTGTLTGTVTDATTGQPLAGIKIAATAPTGNSSATTDARGFYSLQALIPDTYVISFEGPGLEPISVSGVTIQQDIVSRVDQKLRKADLKTIGQVQARSSGSLFKPYSGTDVYNVSGAQLNAATGGDNLHRTVYEYLETVPGVTPIGGAYPGEPSIRGGYDVDNGYELDGIPITERITGFFTSNLTNLGISNVEVYTGGLSASNAGNGLGVINSVIKTGAYPGFGNVAFGATAPTFNFLSRLEYGGATPDKRFSYYFGYDGAASNNQYWTGNYNANFPLSQIGVNSTNPGFINTTDLIANLHYKPNTKNDIQFLFQNGVYDGNNSYGETAQGGPLLALARCPGAVGGVKTATNGSGGQAPNGQPCPLGLYFTSLANGQGNYLGHYSGIGKIQWNHVINDRSSFALRFAENFNEYIFNQTLTDPNSPSNNAPAGGTIVSAGCPTYPYAPGSPLPLAADGSACTQDLGDYYQDRRGNNYFGALDYTLTPNPNVIVRAGIGQEFDRQLRDVRYLNEFNFTGRNRAGCNGRDTSYPCTNSYTDIPTHVPYAYVSASVNIGRLTLEPGLRYSRINYGVPSVAGGTVSAGYLAPSILGTYRLSSHDALRYSFADSLQFIGTEFVYRLNSATYNPRLRGAQAYQPVRNNVTDFQYEHEFDANTSLKVGPYYRASNNYLSSYSPFTGFKAGTSIPTYGDLTLSNNTKIRSFGAELGFSHLDNHPVGASLWISGTYNNYWTQVSALTGGQVSFLGFPLPGPFLQQGVFVRSYQTPLVAGTATLDLHSHGWHVLPVLYYAYDTFYNSGGCIPTDGKGNLLAYTQSSQPVNCASITDTKPALAPEGIGAGYFSLNTTILREINKNVSIGLNVRNVSNNQHSTTPCYNAQDPALATGLGSGCSPFTGARSGTVAPVGYIYQNITQSPRTFEGFMSLKF